MIKSSIINIGLFVFILFSAIHCSEPQELTETKKLEILGKSWGLIKYYHPEVGLGKVNWDSVLLDHISLIKSTKSAEEFNQQLNVLMKVPNSTSLLEKSTGCDSTNIEKLVDLEWIESSDLSTENVTLLKSVLNREGTYRNIYVSDSVGNRSLSYARFYEDPMTESDLSKEEVRLLGLFRYWNVIEYYFPYKNLTDKDWSNVLSEYIPQFISAKNEEEYYECLLRLSTEINDGHANIPYHPELRSAFFGKFTVPFRVKMVENKLVINSLKSDSLSLIAGVEVGDIVEKINGAPFEEKVKTLGNYLPKPNEAFHNGEISRYILNGNTDSLKLSVRRDSEAIELNISRYSFSDIRKFRDKKSTQSWKIIDENIGYAHMGELNIETLPEFFAGIKNTKGLVLDFRHYPQWQVLYDFLGYLYTDVKPFVLLKSQCLNEPGTYYWHASEKDVSDIELKEYRYDAPIMLLVDENTLSFGEFFVMALQVLENVYTVGSQTAGEDGNQVSIDMPGGMKMFMSSLGIYYPNGDDSQRSGVKIDKIVNQKIDDVKAGTDPVLNYALMKLNHTANNNDNGK
ncbi:MAG: S41 family peptidase [Bacteroidota bacterium]